MKCNKKKPGCFSTTDPQNAKQDKEQRINEDFLYLLVPSKGLERIPAYSQHQGRSPSSPSMSMHIKSMAHFSLNTAKWRRLEIWATSNNLIFVSLDEMTDFTNRFL